MGNITTNTDVQLNTSLTDKLKTEIIHKDTSNATFKLNLNSSKTKQKDTQGEFYSSFGILYVSF